MNALGQYWNLATIITERKVKLNDQQSTHIPHAKINHTSLNLCKPFYAVDRAERFMPRLFMFHPLRFLPSAPPIGYDHVQCLRCTLSPHLRRAPVTIGKVKMVKSVHPAVQLLFAYGKSINQSFRLDPHAQLFSLLGGELGQVRLGFGRKTTISHIVIAIR